MTLLDRADARLRLVQLRRLKTGVSRLASADGAPVILLPDLAPEVVAAVAPLLARRREVFVVDAAHDPDDPDADVAADASADDIAETIGSTRVALVGGALTSAVAAALGAAGLGPGAPGPAALGAALDAAVVVGPLPGAAPPSASVTLHAAPLPADGPLPAATLHITAAPAARTGGAPVGPTATAVSGHPVETAHLIDSYLRDPSRYPAGSRVERARP